jgi:N-acetylmuramoyl-L-alanine amidase
VSRFHTHTAVLARVFVLAWIGAASVAAADEVAPERFDIVVIDAGHGGDDTGAHGKRGIVEKELVLDVSRRLAKILRERSLQVVMTRKDDRFVPLEERFALANDARGDLFVSIHANAIRNAEIRGVETFFLALAASDDEARQVASRENDAFATPTSSPAVGDPLSAILGDLIESEYMRESNEFARLAQSGLAGADSAHSRGVKQAPFVVLQGVQMPSALVEIGFITNAEDASRLGSPKGRESVAAALADAVTEFGRRFEARRGVGADRADRTSPNSEAPHAR